MKTSKWISLLLCLAILLCLFPAAASADASGTCGENLTWSFKASTGKLAITTQPKAVTVAAGRKATFKVVAEGATSYRWQYQKFGSTTWTDVSKNGTSATYSLTAAAKHNGYSYRCKITNEAGSVYTDSVTLTVIG